MRSPRPPLPPRMPRCGRSSAVMRPSLFASSLSKCSANFGAWAASLRSMTPSLLMSSWAMRSPRPPLPPCMPRCGRSSAVMRPSLFASSLSKCSANFGALAASLRSMTPSPLMSSLAWRVCRSPAGCAAVCANVTAAVPVMARPRAMMRIGFMAVPVGCVRVGSGISRPLGTWKRPGAAAVDAFRSHSPPGRVLWVCKPVIRDRLPFPERAFP